MKNKYFLIGLFLSLGLLFSCSEDSTDDENIPVFPTSNFFAFGENYFEVSHGAIVYYGDNDYDLFVSDGKDYEEWTDINKYMYFDMASLSESGLASGSYTLDLDGDWVPGTFVEAEFLANDGQSGLSTPSKNPFNKGGSKKYAFKVEDNYYYASDGTIDIEASGNNAFTVDFTMTCDKMDDNWESTGETEVFHGNFSGTFTFFDESSNELANLYLQFIDAEDETYILDPYDFVDYGVELFEDEEDYIADEYSIDFDSFYETYEGYENLFEFTELDTDTDYYLEAEFSDTDGFYEIDGYFGATLDEGDNLYYIYIYWEDAGGKKKMKIDRIEKKTLVK